MIGSSNNNSLAPNDTTKIAKIEKSFKLYNLADASGDVVIPINENSKEQYTFINNINGAKIIGLQNTFENELYDGMEFIFKNETDESLTIRYNINLSFFSNALSFYNETETEVLDIPKNELIIFKLDLENSRLIELLRSWDDDTFEIKEELPTENILTKKIYVLPNGSWNWYNGTNWVTNESESSIKTQISNGYEFFCDFNQSFTNNSVISGELTVSATGGGGNNLQAGIIGTEYQDVLSMIMQTSATSRVFTQSGGSLINGAFEFSTLIIPQTECTLTEKFRLITGLGSTQADSDQLQGIYFLYDKYGEGNVGVASDNYLCVCKNDASISVVDSGIPYQSLVGRKLGFLKNSDGTEVTFSIDNVTVATITTNIPSVSMRVMNVCEKYLGTGSATVSFDYIYYKNFKNRM